MSVTEIQALAQRFADAFDKRDMKTVLEMLSEDVEVFDHVPYRFDGKPVFAKYLNGAPLAFSKCASGVFRPNPKSSWSRARPKRAEGDLRLCAGGARRSH